MTNQPVVLAVATYAARADADHDFDSARLVGQGGRLDHVGAAVVEKGADGSLRSGATTARPSISPMVTAEHGNLSSSARLDGAPASPA
jgi:hypothetical protein